MDAFDAELLKITKTPPGIKRLSEAVSRKSSVYTAFDTGSGPQRMLCLRVNDASKHVDTAPAYAYLQIILTDGNGEGISMNFPFISIRIFGRNLQSLFEKLLKHEVIAIHEFDPRKWNNPGQGEPCVTGIEMRHAADKSREDGPKH